MKRYSLAIIMAFLLAGCSTTEQKTTVSRSQTFHPVSEVRFNDTNFQRGKTVDLIEMVKYVYTPKTKSSSETVSRQKVTLFYDKNIRDMSLQQRMELRQRSYQRSGNTLAELNIRDQTLYSTVIYRPSAQYNYWGVEVTKGKDMNQCGFVEFQYAYAVTAKKTGSDEKTFLNSQVYPYARQSLQQLQQQPWLWQCY